MEYQYQQVQQRRRLMIRLACSQRSLSSSMSAIAHFTLWSSKGLRATSQKLWVTGHHLPREEKGYSYMLEEPKEKGGGKIKTLTRPYKKLCRPQGGSGGKAYKADNICILFLIILKKIALLYTITKLFHIINLISSPPF